VNISHVALLSDWMDPQKRNKCEDEGVIIVDAQEPTLVVHSSTGFSEVHKPSYWNKICKHHFCVALHWTHQAPCRLLIVVHKWGPTVYSFVFTVNLLIGQSVEDSISMGSSSVDSFAD
jgi:hypothetical protein